VEVIKFTEIEGAGGGTSAITGNTAEKVLRDERVYWKEQRPDKRQHKQKNTT